MLYDPKWEKLPETTADPLSTAALVAWLETQDPNTRYNYSCIGECLLAQYFTAAGLHHITVGGTHFSHGPTWFNRDRTELPASFRSIALDRGTPDKAKDFTFGGALRRARAFMR